MKNYILFFISSLLLGSCSPKEETIQQQLDYSNKQMKLLLSQSLEMNANPRTTHKDGSTFWIDTKRFDWTEGFFPGTLWYLYQWSNDAEYKNGAVKLQSLFENQKNASSHDLGFVFNCSYGHGYKLTKDTAMLNVLIDAGDALISRFNPTVGTILSWDVNRGWQSKRGWEYPVIIDNMMNLEMLFNLTEITGDNKYRDVAIAHANTTMKNHFRKDYSSYHVIDYCPATGDVRKKETAQGYAHESSWARGQAWGLYGYTVCYRYTKDPVYLEFAENIAKFIMNSDIPEDKVPYWDYNAPEIPNACRDVSASAITASAMIELDDYAPGKYLNYASDILKSLSSDDYRAKIGENNLFLLKHSVGSIPHNNEIDVPLNYADYYYIEALIRYMDKSNKL